MIGLIATFFLVCLCVMMFTARRENKLAIFLFSTICLSLVTVPFVPFGNSKYFLSICFIISEWQNIKVHYKKIKKTVIGLCVALMIVATIVLIIKSPHYQGSLSQMIRLVMFELVGKYFALAYSFVCVVKENDLKPTLKVTFYGLMLLTLFGVLNYLTKHAIFIDEVGGRLEVNGRFEDLGGEYENLERFRVQAMFMNAFNYGYICILIFILQLWGYLSRFISRSQLLIVTFCSVFGVITCGCRTNILCFIISLLPFAFFKYKMKRQIVIIGSLCLLSVIAYLYIPFFQDLSNNLLSMFSSDSEVKGSSIEMRLLQYGTVFYYVRNDLLFGKGYDFFNIDMGWADGSSESLVDSDLWGLEGALMNHLLERGIVGIVFYLLFYAIIFLFILSHRKVNPNATQLGISCLLLYLSFSNITGDLLSVFPSLLILGISLQLIYNKMMLLKVD